MTWAQEAIKRSRGWSWFLCGLGLVGVLAFSAAAGPRARSDGDTARPRFRTLRELRLIGRDQDSLLQRMSVPALPNARGDLTADSLVNVLDLLRLRDIVRGLGQPPNDHETVAGDINTDGLVTAADLDSYPALVTQQHGLPHVMGSSGGEVAGAGVAMSFAPGEVDPGTILRVDPRTSADIEEASGADFGLLGADSTYFISAFKVEAQNGNYIYPPQMEITTSVMPPCSLSGDNHLMVARRGPLGDTELIYLSSLQVSVDSTLLVPPPPYPTIEAPSQANPGLLGGFRPFDIMLMPAAEFSTSLAGNALVFVLPDGREWPMTPVAFYPCNGESAATTEGLVVPAAPLPPGIYPAYLEHLGTGLRSNTVSITIASINEPASPDPDAFILSTWERFYVFLGLAQTFFDTLNLPDFKRSHLQGIYDVEPALRAFVEDAVAMDDPSVVALRRHWTAVMENQGLRDSVDAVILSLEDVLDGAKRDEAGTRRMLLRVACAQRMMVMSMDVLGDRLSSGEDKRIPTWVYCLLVDSGLVEPAPVLLANQESDFAKRMLVETRRATGLRDGSFDPKPHPGFCPNIWKHRTNLRGNGDRRPPPPPAPPCSGWGGQTRHPCGPGICDYALTDGFPVPEPYMDSLEGGIVTPVNGGIPGITGIIDGAGAFAIPGLQPGADVHLAVYDVRTGLFDPDAGWARAPAVWELGRWFSGFVSFDPDTTVEVLPLPVGEWMAAVVAPGNARFEYVIPTLPQHSGRALSFGFRSSENLTLWVQNPAGAFILRDSLTTCERLSPIVPQGGGAYKVTVTYGATGGDGSFAVGVNWPPYPPTPYLCGTVSADSLYTAYSPYYVANPGTISAGHTVWVEPGVQINFETGGVLTSTGSLRGIATEGLPIVLSPSSARQKQRDAAELDKSTEARNVGGVK